MAGGKEFFFASQYLFDAHFSISPEFKGKLDEDGSGGRDPGVPEGLRPRLRRVLVASLQVKEKMLFDGS